MFSLLALLSGTIPHIVRCGDLATTLGREAKVAVVVTKPLAEHRLYVDRRAAPPLVLLRAAARAVNASLIKTPTGYELRRTTEDRRLLIERQIARHSRWLERRLLKTAEFRRANGGGASEALTQAFDRDVKVWKDFVAGKPTRFSPDGAPTLMPAARLLEGLVRRIGIPALAAIPAGETRVYEDAPVASASFLPAHEELSQAYAQAVDGLEARAFAKDLRERFSHGELEGVGVHLPDPGRPAERLRLACWVGTGGINLLLEAYAHDGRKVDEASLLAGATDAGPVSAMSLRDQAALRPDAAWVDLSPEARDELATIRKSAARAPEWFLDPVGHEPLDGFVREALTGLYGGYVPRPVVGDVPDIDWTLVQGCVIQGRVSLDALQGTIETSAPEERVEEGGVAVWRLRNPAFDEARRADRTALVRYALAFAKLQRPTLRDTARLFHSASPEIAPLAEVWYGQGLAMQAPAWDVGRLTEPTYALLGAVSDSQWDRFTAGETFAAGALGVVPELRRLLADPRTVLAGGGSVPDLFRHPLELYSSASLDATPVALRPSSTPVMRYWQVDTSEGDGFIPLEGSFVSPPVGPIHFRPTETGLVTRTTREGWEEGCGSYYFRTGARTTSELIVGLPHDLRIVQEAPGATYAWQSKFTYRDLPEDVRRANWEKAYADALAQAKELYKDVLGNP